MECTRIQNLTRKRYFDIQLTIYFDNLYYFYIYNETILPYFSFSRVYTRIFIDYVFEKTEITIEKTKGKAWRSPL